MGSLDGKVAIVTGAGTGIGKGIARAFAREGCDVMLAARDRARLTTVAEEIANESGTRVHSLATDVSGETQVRALFDLTLSEFGKLDILVNNAGLVDGGRIDQITPEVFMNVINTNVLGPFLCTRLAFGIMKEAGGGRIINIGSIASNRARPSSTPYTTSKHALWGQLNPGNVAVERRLASGGRSASGVDEGPEPLVETPDMANAALYMATLPPEVNTLEMTVLPVHQTYIGRG